MTEYEQGRLDGILWCVDNLRAIAVESKDEFAEAFRAVAQAWERQEVSPPKQPARPAGKGTDVR